MTGERYDVIVVGVGTMGSAAVYHLARRGVRVLGLERYDIAHDRGSMHGGSRIIRLGYHEHPDYVPLMHRAYELWRELDESDGTPLLHITGVLESGPPEGPMVAGTLLACEEHNLPHEVYDHEEVHEHFPMFKPPPGTMGVYQASGGYIEPERAVQAHVAGARAAGAVVQTGEAVLGWTATADGVEVETDRGTYHAGRLVLSPGAWTPGLMHLPPELFSVERQVVAWFDPLSSPEIFTPDRMPVYLIEEDGFDYYGFPNIDGTGVKLGRMHYPGQRVDDPAELDRTPAPEEIAVLHAFLEHQLPEAAGAFRDAGVCMFTNTPDTRFLLDLHPDEPNVVIGSACSGHGFKFATVVGEILADLAVDGSTRHPIDFLRYSRFAAGAAA